jgi:hypothetical protein
MVKHVWLEYSFHVSCPTTLFGKNLRSSPSIQRCARFLLTNRFLLTELYVLHIYFDIPRQCQQVEAYLTKIATCVLDEGGKSRQLKNIIGPIIEEFVNDDDLSEFVVASAFRMLVLTLCTR